RDGIMVAMCEGGYREAVTATLSEYDRQQRRLGTIYLCRMPEEKQTTLSSTLTALLRATLTAWHGPLPRLAYITDKGSTPDDYYRRVLKKMNIRATDKPWSGNGCSTSITSAPTSARWPMLCSARKRRPPARGLPKRGAGCAIGVKERRTCCARQCNSWIAAR